jgi:hypothetical protein
MQGLYEAFGEIGEYKREPRFIHELGTPEMRRAACRQTAKTIADRIGIKPIGPLFFGCPVYLAFGLSKATAKANAHATLLMTNGSDIPLLYLEKNTCPA